MSGGGEKAAPTSGSLMTLCNCSSLSRPRWLDHQFALVLLEEGDLFELCLRGALRDRCVLPWDAFPVHLQGWGITCVLLRLPHDLSVSHAGSKPSRFVFERSFAEWSAESEGWSKPGSWESFLMASQALFPQEPPRLDFQSGYHSRSLLMSPHDEISVAFCGGFSFVFCFENTWSVF